MSEVLAAQDVTRIYRRGAETVRALDGVTLTVDAGEFVAIVGPSGAGKSTLLQLLGAMDRPTSGSLRVAGQEIGAMSDTQRTRLRREEIGFVFQHFGLLPVLTVEENVALPLALARRAKEPWVSELLERVGLTARRRHRPSELSGGEMQRVAIARALANRPRLLLADEPTGNLDSVTAGGVVELLHDLNRREGITLVVVTHNEALASAADRRLILRDGRIEPVSLS